MKDSDPELINSDSISSDQCVYDLSKFCENFKDFEGQPTNIAEQQDASEFVTNFFQQFESVTMGMYITVFYTHTY